MQEIQRLNFEDHPAVANELVKFLAVNTDFQSIKDLQATTLEIKTDLQNTKK